MTSLQRTQLYEIQDRALRSAVDWFGERDRETVRSLTRIAFETLLFFEEPDPTDRLAERYTCETIFSGLDAYCQLLAVVNTSSSPGEPERLPQVIDVAAVPSELRRRFDRMLDESEFEQRCQGLIGLYRLQLVFAAVTHRADGTP